MIGIFEPDKPAEEIIEILAKHNVTVEGMEIVFDLTRRLVKGSTVITPLQIKRSM